MTNQNNKLDEILDSLYCDAWFAGRVAEREQSGIRSVTPKFDEAKQAIQALYAPKPVENGELRETILSILGIVDRTSGNRPEQIATLEQELTAHTNAEKLKLLDKFENDCKYNYTTFGNSEKMLQVSGLLKRIEAERNKLKEVK